MLTGTWLLIVIFLRVVSTVYDPDKAVGLLFTKIANVPEEISELLGNVNTMVLAVMFGNETNLKVYAVCELIIRLSRTTVAV